ncbi:hypothetical protein MJN47_31540, partial [Salmonella enterica subsp. enterica serovar Lubbock]|nr:hypothetical protein [Salmonella enterica subsp. enterica serovar Lubbock]
PGAEHFSGTLAGSVEDGQMKVAMQQAKMPYETVFRAPLEIENEKDNIMSVFSTVGSGPGGNGQNVARMFVRLKDWDARDPTTGS